MLYWVKEKVQNGAVSAFAPPSELEGLGDWE
jgi:hypothetical protein